MIAIFIKHVKWSHAKSQIMHAAHKCHKMFHTVQGREPESVYIEMTNLTHLWLVVIGF